MRTIKLAHGVKPSLVTEKPWYKVISVKNSTAYHPGQILREPEVDDLCRNNAWDVTIVKLNEESTQ